METIELEIEKKAEEVYEIIKAFEGENGLTDCTIAWLPRQNVLEIVLTDLDEESRIFHTDLGEHNYVQVRRMALDLVETKMGYSTLEWEY